MGDRFDDMARSLCERWSFEVCEADAQAIADTFRDEVRMAERTEFHRAYNAAAQEWEHRLDAMRVRHQAEVSMFDAQQDAAVAAACMKMRRLYQDVVAAAEDVVRSSRGQGQTELGDTVLVLIDALRDFHEQENQ